MPELSEKLRRKREQESLLAAWAEFESGFTRSSKGNLWREHEGLRVTVFKRYGEFRWSISNDDSVAEPRYSPGGYRTEEEAIESLCLELIY